MKRLLSLAAVAALIALPPLSHSLLAVPPQGKVTLCHLTDDPEDFPCGGHYIQVAQNAVEKHLEHGDFIEDGVVGELCDCPE